MPTLSYFEFLLDTRASKIPLGLDRIKINSKSLVKIKLPNPKKHFKRGDRVIVKCFMGCDINPPQNGVNGHFEWCNKSGVIIDDKCRNYMGEPKYLVRMNGLKDPYSGKPLEVSVLQRLYYTTYEMKVLNKKTHFSPLNLELIK